jgi:hypothetical protein
MGSLSARLTSITMGTGSDAPTIQRCTINPTSGAHSGAGLNSGTGILVTGDFKAATRIWNAVWNDLADFQLLNDELVFGACYFDTKDGARICNERCQLSVIGIASDTYGFGLGLNPVSQVPIAVAGWVLAFVDNEYPCGTPLTNNEKGMLTEMTLEEKMHYPERLVAIYKRKEMDKLWGPEGKKIEVKDRHWVRVK